MIQHTKNELRTGKPDRHEYAKLPKTPVYIICDGLKNSHNIGAIFRLSAALMIEKVYICNNSYHSINRKFKKTARDSYHWIDWENPDSTLDVIHELKTQGVMIVSVELAHNSIHYREAQYRFPVAFVLGNESFGVSEEVLSLSDMIVHLPIPGMINSLNVSTAAGVVLYDVYEKYVIFNNTRGQ